VAAGEAEMLKGRGPFTLFAPADEAFVKMSISTLRGLFNPDNRERLIKVVNFHIAPGRFSFEDISGMDEIKMLNGETATITVKEIRTLVHCSMIVKTDIECSNGIIHAIDEVMLPG
jgi:uncharacterized surface protein with fasciclin (FAS1) repeats